MDNLGGIRSEDETRDYHRINVEHWERHGHGLWMLTLRTDGSFVGRAALRHRHIGGHDEVALGYALLPEYWGRGFATEIVGAIVDLAFSQFRFESVVAGALHNNHASRRVMEKVGGRYEKDTFYKNRPHVMYRFKPARTTGVDGR
jgi:RimJ/RimL family protein N-acetyltransferase